MVPDARRTLLGLEYFCAENDSLWSAADAEILALAARELRTLGLVDAAHIAGGTVVRQAKAYPVYDHTYSANVDTIRRHTAAHFPGLHVAGRNGMHKYDNQDHAMLTGILAARNIMGGSYDVWRVNADAEYLEEAGSDSGLRLVPARLRREPPASAEA
jgi:protoporphyrinogen oxidase